MNTDYISLYPSLVNPGPSLELIIVFKPFKNTHFIMFFLLTVIQMLQTLITTSDKHFYNYRWLSPLRELADKTDFRFSALFLPTVDIMIFKLFCLILILFLFPQVCQHSDHISMVQLFVKHRSQNFCKTRSDDYGYGYGQSFHVKKNTWCNR